MSALALLLILAAAVAHAAWNLFAKRACGGTPFIWLFALASAVIYFPLVLLILVVEHPVVGWWQIGFMLGSAVLHCFYFILLDRGYRVGDLSVIYPLARGTGPMLTTVAAVFLLGEQPTVIALCGTMLIGLGVFLLTGNPRKLRDPVNRRPILFALLTGVVIASYTVWDKQAVSWLLVPPLLQDWGTNFGRMLLLTPAALKHRDEVVWQWRVHRKEIIGVAILSPLAYILVLTAMSFSPVSYIAPAREISILFGTVMGAKLLGEGEAVRRLAAAGLMVAGLVALAFG